MNNETISAEIYEDPEVADYLRRIENAKTLDELNDITQDAMHADYYCELNDEQSEVVANAIGARCRELEADQSQSANELEANQ